ncbi:MAG: nucleotidyltransferase domain-containing protein [Spirochaetota bacterium]|nr:nucleotidyltransferase domain-containing protein [Spirochaetota bacterium]
MDKNDASSLARQYALVIKANYDCKQIFLFGSYAGETHHEESDIDIAVILREFENPIDIQLELMRLRRNIDSRIEPHPFREKNFNMSNPIVHEILKHGQRIDTDFLDNLE